MSGDLNMNEQRVKNTLDPTDEQDTVNKRYLESQLSDYLKRNGQSPMTFDLNMNSYKIVNLEDPDNDGDATNKKYVKDEIAKIQSIDTSNFLKKSGGVMTGPIISMNRNDLIGIPDNPRYGYSAINRTYVTNNFLKLDGSVDMSGDLNMANHKITNTVAPTADGDIATKKYVDESHITPSEHFRENAFRYLMEDADESSSENNISVSGIVRFDASIHQNDKNAYRMTLIKDLGSDNYRSRIGFNLGSLPIGYYTLVCEFFPIVMSNVSVTALGTTISINSQATKTFPTYAKTVVQFHRWNSTPPQFIYFDLHGSETSNARRILAHMVVYGVKGYFPNVPSSVFDQIYVVNNGRMVMQTDLDLHGHQLVNNNLKYSINGSFDRDQTSKLNRSIYFTFDKLPHFIFMAPCTIKDYILNIEYTDVDNVYESHDILFTIISIRP